MRPIKSKFLYYLLTFTWGIFMSLVGGLVALQLMILGYKPIKNHYGLVFIIGTGWGGVNLGPVSIVNSNPSQHILDHEFGHSVQNCYLGPFFLFLVALPSMVRYWYREYLVRVKHKKYSELPEYDAIWFEGGATRLGEKYGK